MNPAKNCKSGWPLVGMMAVLLATAPAPARAQSQRKTPPKPSSSQETEDPLAPLLQQAKDAMDKMDFAAALEPLQKYIAQRPEDPYAHFQMGYSYAGLKRQDDAKTEFSRAIALDPKMAAAQLNLGLVLIDSDPGAAAEAFLHAAELQPTESRPRFLAGFSLEHAGKFAEAIEQYRAAQGLSPKDYEVHFALGRVLLRTGDAPGAEGQFREAVAARGDSAPARLGLANALLAEKKNEAASDALNEYLKLNPGDRSARFDLASALFDLDRFNDALAELDRAEAGSAPTADTLKMRGDIYMQQKKWKEAGEALTQAIRISPQDGELAVWVGHVDIELHEYPAAIDILGQVVKQNPQSAWALSDLINALFLHEDYAATIGAMDQLAKLEPPKPASWFVRAICYDKLSQKAAAIEAYQRFLDQDNGQHDTQDFQARHRILTLQGELGKSTKKK
jgi:tetratricopeptide (TPR) repeat protein